MTSFNTSDETEKSREEGSIGPRAWEEVEKLEEMLGEDEENHNLLKFSGLSIERLQEERRVKEIRSETGELVQLREINGSMMLTLSGRRWVCEELEEHVVEK